jgi:hypothetical protein
MEGRGRLVKVASCTIGAELFREFRLDSCEGLICCAPSVGSVIGWQ